MHHAEPSPEKLSSIVRSVSMSNETREQQQQQHQRNNPNTPVQWDSQMRRDRSGSRESIQQNPPRDGREPQPPPREKDSRETQRERIERYGSVTRHARNESAGTGVASSGEYGESQATNSGNQNGGRRHDYDVQSMESALSSPRASLTKNPIPAPTVTVRSEYPTLSRSRQQQSLTCLVTIEVPEGKWSPDPADLRGAPTMPIMHQENTFGGPNAPEPDHGADWAFESPEALEEITEDLRVRVDNWHGLDFQRWSPTWNDAWPRGR